MGSFLKRISPASQLRSNSKKIYSNIVFDIDEPDFLLKRKFNANPMLDHSNWRVQQYLNQSTPRICPNCGNNQFSNQARFCRVCGTEVYPE